VICKIWVFGDVVLAIWIESFVGWVGGHSEVSDDDGVGGEED
jgi:hypothetical protein